MMEEVERLRRIAEFGVAPLSSPLLAAIGDELPKNLVQCDLHIGVYGVFAVGKFPSVAEKKPAHIAAAEAERARRVAEYGTGPVPSPCRTAVVDELPRNLLQCYVPDEPVGAFAVGSFPAPPAPRRSEQEVAAEDERARRVAERGTGLVVSPCCQAVKDELPRNLVSCDLCHTEYGVFALKSVVKTYQEDVKRPSGVQQLIQDDKAEPEHAPFGEEYRQEEDAMRKVLSDCALSLLSSSPTSVTASASVGNLLALY